ncbi:MAG: hypothetical protein JNJ60_18355 [Rhodocyclaceae bacterium]|nr:hypothetical protein [Rhodocyclaceae bacterium]
MLGAMLASVTAAQTAPADPFAQGRDWAAGKAANIGGGVTDAGARGNMPEYHDAAGASEFFNGGQGAPIQPGQVRRGFCAAPGGPLGDRDKYDCDAVNLMQGVGNARPAVQINRHTDPLITNPTLDAARNAPGNYVGIAPGGDGSSCVTRTVSAPGAVRIETCTARFAFEAATCQKALSVTVTTSPSCEIASPIVTGTALPAIAPSQANAYYIEPICAFGTGANLHVRNGSYAARNGCGTHEQIGNLDFSTVDTRPHFLMSDSLAMAGASGGCQRSYYYVQRHGCSDGHCSARFFFSEAGSHPFDHSAGDKSAYDFPSTVTCSNGGLVGSYYQTLFGQPYPAACYVSANPLTPGTVALYHSSHNNPIDAQPTDTPATFVGYYAVTTVVPQPSFTPASWVHSVLVEFDLPHTNVQTTDAWDDGCSNYEARE